MTSPAKDYKRFKQFYSKKCFVFYPVPSSSRLPQELINGSPQLPMRDRSFSEPGRFTFASVSSGLVTEEESSSCFDYTSDQVGWFDVAMVTI